MGLKEMPPGAGPRLPEEDFCTKEELDFLTKMMSQSRRTEDDWTKIKDLLYNRLVYSAVPQKSSSKKKYSRHGLFYIPKDHAAHVATCKEYLLETLREEHLEESDVMITMMYFDGAREMALDAGCNLIIDEGNKDSRGYLLMIPQENRIISAMRTDTLTEKELMDWFMNNLWKNMKR